MAKDIPWMQSVLCPVRSRHYSTERVAFQRQLYSLQQKVVKNLKKVNQMPETNDQFNGMEEVRLNQIKFGKVGDWIRGTLTDNTREIENKLSGKHEMQTIYEFKILGGSFHNIVDKVPQPEATIPVVGDYYSYFAKGVTRNQLRKAKLGQIVGLRFDEDRPSNQPGFNNTKIIKVYLGEMDPDYQGEQGLDT